MRQPREGESEEPTEPTAESTAEPAGETAQPAGGDEEEPTEARPARWTGSARVPAPEQRRRRRGVLREPTAELPTLDDGPWPPPPPPRPANAPVTAPYPPRPPAWNPPPPGGPRYPVPQYPPRFRRRRRRWPWVLTTLMLLVVACCACCVSWLRPYDEQYPASASLPPQVAGLVKLDDPASVAASKQLEAKVRTQQWLAEGTFAAIYAEPKTSQRPVVIFGATLFVLDPDDSLRKAFDGLAGGLSLTDVGEVPAGPAGGHMRCGRGRNPGQARGGGEAVTVCGWADHGSMAVGIFSGRNVEQSAGLLRELRSAIITRG